MQTLEARILHHAKIPPVPASPGHPHMLLWHPIDKALWLLVLSHRQLWRVDADGTGKILAAGSAIGLPEGFPDPYLHGHAFYFDTARKAAVWLFSTYAERFGHGLMLGAWNGSAFAPIAQENGIKVASSDSFVFDPARGVLVHFAGQRDMSVQLDARRKARGGLTVRELGKDGVWRDVGEPLPKAGAYETYAGWDERRKLAVFIDNETNETHGWDGKKWRALGELPDYPWKPNTLTQAPRSKSLVFLHNQRSNDDPTALLWELTDKGWSKRKAGPLEAYGGAAHDPESETTFVFGPWLGPGTVQTTLGRYDGEKIVLAGKPVPAFTGASSSGPAVFWGERPQGHGGFAREARRSYTAAAVSAFVDGALSSLAPSPPALALAAGAGGCLAVGSGGEVSRLAGRKWSRIAKPPAGFAERDSANVGTDGAGRLFLVGGEPVSGSKRLTDAWLFDGSKWSEVPAKGPAPSATGAHVTFDAARGVWILAGGNLKDYSPNPKTYEHDGKKWSAFPASFGNSGASLRGGISLLAHDVPSSTTFAIGSPDYGPALCIYFYRGAGVWDPIATFDRPDGATAVAYDSVRRVLVTAGAESLGEIDIASLFSAAKAASSAEPVADSPAKKGKGAKAKDAAPAEEKIAPEVWLRVRDGDSDKFWFASRKGAAWTARWGRRGGKVSEKSHGLDTAALAKAAYEKAVRDKIRDGYEHAPEKEDAAKIPGKTAFRMKIGKKGEDAFGGIPAGITKKTWPVCADCKHPMQHVLTLHAHEERLSLKKHAAIALFACNGAFSGGACETWEADEGCNAALLLTAEDLAKKALKSPPAGPEGEEAPEVIAARKIAYTPQFEADPRADENPEDIEATSKVGGYPVWIQGDDTPECDRCEKEMRFVAQIQEVDDALNFGGGDGYLFACPDEHQAKFCWQQ